MGHPHFNAPALGAGTKQTARLGSEEPAGNHFSRRPEIEVFHSEALQATLGVIIAENGAPWFAAADVLRALDVASSVLRKLDADEQITLALPGTNNVTGWQSVELISESGLYALLGMFLLCGRDTDKPDPAPLRKWIANAVLPYLHRHHSDIGAEIVELVEADEALAA